MNKTLSTEEELTNELKALKSKVVELEQIESERKKEIESLAHRLHLYELAASGANDGLWDINLDTNESFVSLPVKAMLGYSESEISNDWKEYQKLIHPDDYDTAITVLQEYILGKRKAYEMEFRMLHKNGSYRWIFSKGTLIYGQNGKPYRISGAHTDITERKKAEEDVRKSERKYKNLFENSLVGMARIDLNKGVILEANNKALATFELFPAELPVSFDYFNDPADKEKVLDVLQTEGFIENMELQFKKKDGSLFWVSLSANYYDKEPYAEFVLNDITETKENLLELQKVNFELDNFVYHASHDLRSPLRSVLGLVDILRIEKDDKERAIVVDMIEGSIKRLDALVKDLLSISRNNRVNDPYVNVNFLLEVNGSLASVYHIQDTQNLEVICKISQLVPFYSDLTRVRIILNNLLSNAIKYRSYERERSYVDVEIEVSEEKVSIKISDNGEGIPEDKQATVFDMFVRASESSEGSGLGLYIVKNVLEKLNGKIRMDSVYQEGTSFYLEIPNGTAEDRLS
jgi:PAS domain S-box-containing protein